MPAASAQPVYRSIAHRKAVMQHIGATLLPSAIAFAVLAPLAGLALIWGSTLVAMICNAISTSGDSVGPALAVIWDTLVSAYLASAIAAGITGVWVALLSPFASTKPDGLEHIAALHGFAASKPAAPAGLFSDYEWPGVGGGRLATALAGVFGTLLVMILGLGLSKLTRRASPERFCSVLSRQTQIKPTPSTSVRDMDS